jgi:hypothetical protein
MELGFDEIYLHYVGQEQQRFIEVFGENSPISTYGVRRSGRVRLEMSQ